MEKAKVYLFTSPTCPHCPSAKKFINNFKATREDFDLIELSTITPEGQKKAEHFICGRPVSCCGKDPKAKNNTCTTM